MGEDIRKEEVEDVSTLDVNAENTDNVVAEDIKNEATSNEIVAENTETEVENAEVVADTAKVEIAKDNDIVADTAVKDSKDDSDVEEKVVHTKCLWFWNTWDKFVAMLERHIPHTVLQFIKYSILSASAGAVEVVTNTILTFALKDAELGTTPYILGPIEVNILIPTLVGLILGILWNFTVNRKFTFKSSGNIPRAMSYVFLFYLVITPLKTLWNGKMPEYLYGAMGEQGAAIFINICGMFIIGFLEFCYQKFFVYRKEEGSALKKKKA